MDANTTEVSPENMQVSTDTISEPTFLLTELRYTLGQLHVQLGDLNEEARNGAACEGRTINQLLGEMIDNEGRYQDRYRQILKCAPAERGQEPGFVGQNEFERRRAETIALVEQAGESWPQELIDTVRQQVQEDRAHTTAIAECRRTVLEQPMPAQLSEPLTEPGRENNAGAVT